MRVAMRDIMVSKTTITYIIQPNFHFKFVKGISIP